MEKYPPAEAGVTDTNKDGSDAPQMDFVICLFVLVFDLHVSRWAP